MHIIIGFFTALATLLFALDRLGVDLGWFNPWAWKRRRAWMKQVTGNPAFSLDSPIDAIALLATAAAKVDGDLSIDEKEALKKIFQETFNKSEKDASQLLGSSVYLLGSGEEIYRSPEKVLANSLESFSIDQKESSIKLLNQIVSMGGKVSELQVEFVSKVERSLLKKGVRDGW